MKVRKIARVVVLHLGGAMLLVRYHEVESIEPDRPGPHSFWVPPGGGVDDGESYEQAAVRELEEETGIDLPGVGPQIWSRERELYHDGELKRYAERYFIAWTEPPQVLRNRTREPIDDIRWWTLDELRASAETFYPDGLAELVAPIMAGDLPAAPIDVA